MGRTVAVVWHASFTVIAGVLYFFFVLPRWPELNGDTSPTLGTVLRIVTGALIGLAALPVVFTLLRTRRPEFGTPRLALALRIDSIVLQVLAGVLIIGAAISEIWLDLDSAGQWLFGLYGAAAALALLATFCFYLAFVAELPPPPPKPLKPKDEQRRRRRGRAGDASDETPSEEPSQIETADEHSRDTPDTPDSAGADAESDTQEEDSPRDDGNAPEDSPERDEPETGGLRNRRPSGKSNPSRRRRRSRGGVAVDE